MSVEPEVVVLPTYDDIEGIASETAPWRDLYEFEHTVDVPGVPYPFEYTDDGVALVPTGVRKAGSTTSMTALLAADALDLSESLLLTVGVAGAPPDVPVGSVVVTDTILDWDDKCRIEPDDEDVPLMLDPYTSGDGVFELNSDLVDRAAELARDVDLVPTPSDDDADFAEVLTGTNVCADEFWHGGEVARQVEWLVDQHDAGQYRVTEVEDAGTATALERFDMLDQYLSIRGVSNYDRPTDDRTPRENVFSQEFESGFEVGVENSVAVGRAIVEDRLS